MAQKKKISIDYTATDFNSIKSNLVEYSKRYYQDSNKDFSESSFGSLATDMVAYVGDILNYYLTYSSNECFLDSALEYSNIQRIGRSLGYKFKGVPTSYGIATFYIICPSDSYGRPDSRYLPTLLKGSTFGASNGAQFILRDNVDFSKTDNEIIVATVNSTTGNPSGYAVKTFGTVMSGQLEEQIITVGPYQKFLKVKLSGKSIAEVLSVVDSEGHDYYEVEHLSQNVIYRAVTNSNAANDGAPSILKPITVFRRFTVERDGNDTYLQFGAGDTDLITANNLADPSNVALQLLGKDYVTDTSFDPSVLAISEKFGVAPSSTDLKILTRTNDINFVNLSTGALTEIKSPIFEFRNRTQLNQTQINNVVASLECSNSEPITGGITVDSSDELRIRIEGNHAAQNRAVTALDYKAAVYSMPAQFGSVKRCNPVEDKNSFKQNINMYLIGEAADGMLAPVSNVIKQNLKNWLVQKKTLGSTIDLLDAVVVNIGINFEIVAMPDVNRYAALQAATSELVSQLNVVQDIGEGFDISNIYQILKSVDSVLDVVSVEIVNKKGGRYSDVAVSVDDLIDPSGRFIRGISNVIYEVKYNSDIHGSVS